MSKQPKNKFSNLKSLELFKEFMSPKIDGSAIIWNKVKKQNSLEQIAREGNFEWYFMVVGDDEYIRSKRSAIHKLFGFQIVDLIHKNSFDEKRSYTIFCITSPMDLLPENNFMNIASRDINLYSREDTAGLQSYIQSAYLSKSSKN